ncbi:MAG TPA: CpsD/CapB family tyrosine-protein kinase [Ktedonobacteraceae bacterium]|nr:CpsD/CapB family tyrosine-protein kinase [Ktedonobacteraceae bacterium]
MGTPFRQEQVALLSDYDIGSAYYAAYTTLCANIRFSWEGAKTQQHTVLLAAATSTGQHATVAANLAIAAAQSGTPTILIDADLSTPSLQKRFGTTQQRGLSDLLTEGASRPQTIFPLLSETLLSETFIPNLRLLSAGSSLSQPEQAPLLLSNRLSDILNALRQIQAEAESRPSLIIFHAPPILSSISTAQISALVDQTFLVISNGQTTRTQARRAQEQLEKAHATLSGLVMLDI